MTRDKAKRKVVEAIRRIVDAAKELAKIEQAELHRKPRKPTVLSGEGRKGTTSDE